jgi:Tol biopolymer transport system component
MNRSAAAAVIIRSRILILSFAPRSTVNMPRGCALALVVVGALICGCAGRAGDEGSAAADAGSTDTAGVAPGTSEVAPEPGEKPYLANIRQLTFEGQNAEAYFSPDDEWLILQSTSGSLGCDQIFTMRADGSDTRMVSTGAGVTTCAYFVYPDARGIIYSSTHLADSTCPPRPDYSRGYVWPVHPGYDVFRADVDGGKLERLTQTLGYDAEATFRRDGSRIVFTSVRDGDLDLYTMDADGGNVRRLTDEVGYDGGAFFSYDGSKIVWRAHHPTDPEEIADYRALLADNLVRPSRMEIWVMNSDGSGKRQLTSNGAANFAPYFTPDGGRIVFASNVADPEGRNFDLYMIDVDGTDLTRITFHPDFDAFPMFSSDGRKMLWASNRNASEPGETNIFVAEWIVQ